MCEGARARACVCVCVCVCVKERERERESHTCASISFVGADWGQARVNGVKKSSSRRMPPCSPLEGEARVKTCGHVESGGPLRGFPGGRAISKPLGPVVPSEGATTALVAAAAAWA